MMLILGTMMYQNVQIQHELDAAKDSISILEKKEKDAEIVKSISSQMEEIAYQQKYVSDMEREEAVQQAQIAQKMRLSAEKERQLATESEMKAMSALSLAEDQKHIADEQRKNAEQQRMAAEEQRKQAEEQRHIAENEREIAVKAKTESNKLRLITIGRNLGTMAVNQYAANNKDLAMALAYTAWYFISTNDGNLFTPEVFEALTLTGSGRVESKEHQAGVSALLVFDKNAVTTKIVSCGRYGEIIETTFSNTDNRITGRKVLFSDKAYDFRDLYIDKFKNIFAMSYDNKLVKVSHTGKISVLTSFPESTKNDMKRGKIVKENNVVAEGDVFVAAGNKKGEIILKNKKTGDVKKLNGHSSAITDLVFVDNSLFSCSLDGELLIWNVSSSVVSPVILLDKGVWIYDMEKSNDNQTLWLGCGDGSITALFISPKKMLARLKNRKKRDLTIQEWKEYVGDDVPYISFGKMGTGK